MRRTAPRALNVDDSVTRLAVSTTPRFSWQVVDSSANQVQTAYEILVSTTPTTDPTDTSVVWDSGTVKSAEQTYVPYGGPALTADTRYYWTVRTSDRAGTAGPFAHPQRFDTGLADADWQASWIRRDGAVTAARPEDYSYVRKDVTLNASPITRAVAYASASHQYQLWINGKRVDYGPSFSYPDKQYYQATDVTKALRAGKPNAVGLLYHWYGSGQGRPAAEPGVIAQLSITHADGTHETVVTDGSWRTQAAEWLPAPLRNDEGDHVEIIAGPGVSEGLGRARIQRFVVGAGHGARPSSGRSVDAPRRAGATSRRAPDPPGVAEAPEVGRLRRRLRQGLRRGADGHLRRRFRRPHRQAPCRLPARSRWPGVHHEGHPRHRSQLPVHRERAGAQTFRPYLYMGFRYLQIDKPGETLKPADVVAYARHTKVPDEHAGTFSSSNPTLNKIYELARHSALYGSQEQFVDTPTREKGQFARRRVLHGLRRPAGLRRAGPLAPGAPRVHQLAGALLARRPRQRRRADGEGARDIPDGTEGFPAWVWETYQETGDRALLERRTR